MDEDPTLFSCKKVNVVFGFCPGGQKLEQYTFRSGAMLKLHRRDWTARAKIAVFCEFLDCSLIPCKKVNVVFGFCAGGQELVSVRPWQDRS